MNFVPRKGIKTFSNTKIGKVCVSNASRLQEETGTVWNSGDSPDFCLGCVRLESRPECRLLSL
jgi:hypothetical protein